MSDRPTPETDAGWLPPFSYDVDEDGAYQVGVLANPKHTQGAWVKIEDYRRLERQRDELLDELTVIRTVASYPNHPNALHAIQSISKNAIAAVKGATT